MIIVQSWFMIDKLLSGTWKLKITIASSKGGQPTICKFRRFSTQPGGNQVLGCLVGDIFTELAGYPWFLVTHVLTHWLLLVYWRPLWDSISRMGMGQFGIYWQWSNLVRWISTDVSHPKRQPAGVTDRSPSASIELSITIRQQPLSAIYDHY